MLVLSLLRDWLRRRKVRRATRLASTHRPFGLSFRPLLEALEDRVVPAGPTGATGIGTGSLAVTISAVSPDNGVNHNDGLTNAARLTVTGTATANAAVSVSTDGLN